MTRVLSTFGAPQQADFAMLEKAARQRWADMFTLRIVPTADGKYIEIRANFSDARAVTRLDPMVAGELMLRKPRLFEPVSAADPTVPFTVTQWAIADTVDKLAQALGPVEGLRDQLRVEREETRAAEHCYQYEKRIHNETRDRITAFKSLPWHRRLIAAWRNNW